jgi:hypothetical protein
VAPGSENCQIRSLTTCRVREADIFAFGLS